MRAISSSLIAMTVASVPPAFAAPRKKQALETRAAPRTALRTSDLSVVLGRARGQQELRHVSVEVRNVGRNEAHQVQVVARAPGGARVVLRGPKTLQAGGRAVYLTSSRSLVVGSGRVSVEAGCLECR